MEKSDTINLYEILKKDLDKKGKNWNVIEKSLYIYLETCKYFNYDETYYGGNYNVINKKLDITAVDTNKIVCSSWSHLYKDLTTKLLCNDADYLKTTINHDEDEHLYINVITRNYETLLLDPIFGNDFCNVTKDFEIQIGSEGGIMYFNSNNTTEENNKIIKNMLKKINNDYSCNYLDYLKLVKQELEQKYKTNDLSSLTNNQLNDIFIYILTTTSFDKLGVIEANSLIYRSMIEILGYSPSNRGFDKAKNYKESYYDLYVPINNTKETYRLYRKKDDTVSYKKI